MLIKYIHDGDLFLESEIGSNFEFNERKDFRRAYKGEEYDFDSPEYDLKIAFVGFILTDEEMLVSLPKGYIAQNKQDLHNIFKLIKDFSQKHPDLQIGSVKSKSFETNYPFESFYKIYDYYLENGLFLERKQKSVAGIYGKVDWKKTISKSNKYIINNDIIVFPLYSNIKMYYNDFITYAMHYAINSTLSKMDILLQYPLLEEINYDVMIFKNSKYVVEILYSIRGKIYNDKIIKLIEALITFYKKVKSGKQYFIKHYYFSSIWEVMTQKYISDNCADYNEFGIVFGSKNINFKKENFYPNESNPSNYISIDSYATKGKTQYIFDAKYYASIDTINYKQVAYSLFLKDMVDKGNNRKFDLTYSVLLLPGESYSHETHFKLKSEYGNINKDIIIYCDYLNIKDVIEHYLKK